MARSEEVGDVGCPLCQESSVCAEDGAGSQQAPAQREPCRDKLPCGQWPLDKTRLQDSRIEPLTSHKAPAVTAITWSAQSAGKEGPVTPAGPSCLLIKEKWFCFLCEKKSMYTKKS